MLSPPFANADRTELPLGLPALFEEMSDQGIDIDELFATCSGDPGAPDFLDMANRVSLFQAAQRLARRSDTALRAGRRQQIGSFGVFGFALATSRTFDEAFQFGRDHINLAGTVVRITYTQRGNIGILRSHNPGALGCVLPFAAEFWRSSMTTLMAHVLGERFPSTAMYFPYPAPRHASAYKRVFGCPIHFNSDVMEWHFDARILKRPCPNFDASTSKVCQAFCERVAAKGPGQTPLQKQVRRLCLSRRETPLTARAVAAQLGLSVRTLYRRLGEEGVTFQSLQDETWRTIAIEYLENTNLPIEQVAFRCGYGDPSNFRKAFHRWTGRAPSAFRSGQGFTAKTRYTDRD